MKVPKGNPYHSATSGELAIYRANSLILRKVSNIIIYYQVLLIMVLTKGTCHCTSVLTLCVNSSRCEMWVQLLVNRAAWKRTQHNLHKSRVLVDFEPLSLSLCVWIMRVLFVCLPGWCPSCRSCSTGVQWARGRSVASYHMEAKMGSYVCRNQKKSLWK